MKVGLCTLGCKVNIYESEYITSKLKEAGYEIGDFNNKNDIYVINTCTVTNNSDAKSRKMIHHARSLNKDACLVVCGCFVESNKNYDFKDVDIIIGNHNKSKIVSLIDEYFKDKKQLDVRENIMKCPFDNMEINDFNEHTRAFVKIQDGCDNYCSYCVIPFVRGHSRSKNKDLVLEEISNLVKKGYKEIVLTGIHTGNYGKDINTTFSNLLEEILEIDGLERIRISSIEITELDDKFFELLKNEKICNHLHIPLQSGCDKTLKLMNRKYDTDFFYKTIEKIRSIRGNISVTTDVIVGFPDETEEDFYDSLSFIEKVNFSKVHAFPYSRRENTRACTIPNHLSNEVKKKRNKKLIELSNKMEHEYKLGCVGKKEKVLIEENDGTYSYGHTSNYLYLKIDKNLEKNKIYDIIIEEKFLNL